MSDPLFLVDPARLDADRIILDGPEGRHAATVQRITPGESVLVSDGAGRGARCRVLTADRSELGLEVVERLEQPEPRPRLVLAQALAKGDRDLQAIEAATELDVDEVVPWQADRSVVRWRGERAAKSLRRWDQALVAATKQSRRLRRPTLADPVGRNGLLARAGQSALALVLHEEATDPLAEVELPDAGDVLLVVGPEGGISTEELDALVHAGAAPVRLGATVLRTSTAGPAALAVLAARGRWR
ncbi:Ribosomal RNA small subunit methyltransferase E [Serinicoccus hydrothermalis]|uniref:Ribosomal RNA small subunit methyltransferase E n=1 Tax=Serinicoccus hydrothermalis TaxID=1758689 RepID=A0A1B1N7Q1_9MICO|nr:16S rRNA (uracil(1498)-N(3))-methyltransferase [Serinicoccus hydrothermalis]ANS77462.1 Ribosomal RNA small subunit methyltransferase E [Serinicoccus hydrothermalis]